MRFGVEEAKKKISKPVKRLRPCLSWPKKINWRLLGKVGEWLVVAVLAMVAVVTAMSALKLPNGVRLYTVQTGSMAPRIPTGSIVVIKPASEYREGDVITFKDEGERYVEQPTKTTTHRIYAVKESDGNVGYITKGDFNPSPDSTPIDRDLILGKVIFSAPLLGYPVAFAKTAPGLVILIVIPATILIYSEILSIKSELRKIKQRKAQARTPERDKKEKHPPGRKKEKKTRSRAKRKNKGNE